MAQWSSEWVLVASAPASSENLLERQILRLHPRLAGGGGWGVGLTDLCFNKTSLRMHAVVWEPLL